MCISLLVVVFSREQRTLDLENRARYQALHNRWVVLDRTVTFGDDEPVGNSQEYLELSEGEEGEEEEEKEKGKLKLRVRGCSISWGIGLSLTTRGSGGTAHTFK